MHHNPIANAYAAESAYFLLIFSSHLFDKLRGAYHDQYSSKQAPYATLASTFLLWLRQAMQYIKFYAFFIQTYDTGLLRSRISICNVVRFVFFLTLE